MTNPWQVVFNESLCIVRNVSFVRRSLFPLSVCSVSLFLPVLCFAQALKLYINNPTAAPYTTDRDDGLLDIVVSEAFRRVGLELVLIKVPAERALRNANEGIDDGDLSRIAGLEKVYPNLIRVPEHLFVMKFVAFSRFPGRRFDHWRSLEPYTIGLIRGWKILENGTQGFPSVLTLDNAAQLFRMLRKGRLDVALYSQALGLHIIQQQGWTDVFPAAKPLATRRMYLYLHKKHRRRVPRIAAALADIKREGLYDRLYQEKIAALDR